MAAIPLYRGQSATGKSGSGMRKIEISEWSPTAEFSVGLLEKSDWNA